MKAVIEWIKGNILADIAILIVVVSVGFMVFIHLKAGELKSQMEARSKEISKISQFMRGRLVIPSEDPNEKPVEVTNLTFNEATFEAVQRIQERMKTEATATTQFLVNKNQAGHSLLIEGMLPDVRNTFKPRQEYLLALQELLAPFDPNARFSGLNAGLPTSAETISIELEKVRNQFMHLPHAGGAAAAREPMRPAEPTRRTGRFAGPMPVEEEERGFRPEMPSATGLSEGDQKRLIEALQQRLASLLDEEAKKIHIYADPRMVIQGAQSGSSKNAAFPFQVADWALGADGKSPGTLPNDQQIYEGQLEFWIQKDIAQAIFLANRVGEEGTSVLTSPVKRLIRVDVLPGYVGLHGGAAPAFSQPSSVSTAAGGDNPIYPIPAPGAIGDPNTPIPDNFLAGPTGRASNAIYDVRHVRVQMVVDAAKLPEVYNAIGKVNLMTVIDADITDIDEYAAMREGYYYKCDAVEVDMLIETIWLRQWTRGYMPAKTKLYLGVETPTPAQ